MEFFLIIFVVLIVVALIIFIGIVLFTTKSISNSIIEKNKKTLEGNKDIQVLPNSNLILVFGIISIATFCFTGIGLIFGVIAIILAVKATKLYSENPEEYTGYKNMKTGKILAIIGVILSSIFLLYMFSNFFKIYLGFGGLF
jgi:hypothetical protein